MNCDCIFSDRLELMKHDFDSHIDYCFVSRFHTPTEGSYHYRYHWLLQMYLKCIRSLVMYEDMDHIRLRERDTHSRYTEDKVRQARFDEA